MGIRILEGMYDGSQHAAVLVDSVTDTAFGPLFNSSYHAEHFLEWLRENVTSDDARKLSAGELAEAHASWSEECLDEEGDLPDEAGDASPS
jgi:hypothetical protein